MIRTSTIYFVLLPTLVRPSAADAAEILKDPAGDMTLVPAGTFVFGSDDFELDEQPRQERDLPAFWIDVTEVTNAAYARFVESTGHAAPPDWPEGTPPAGLEQYPVVNVSWLDASAFASWAKKRLPSELEWERAARGVDGRRFPWGDSDDTSRHSMREAGRLLSVDSLPEGKSPAGCFHMFGNAWEWCADWYGAYPGSQVLSVHFGKKYRVFRGGGAVYFYGIPLPRSVTVRGRGLSFARHDALGFRCARDAAPDAAVAGHRCIQLSVREDSGATRTDEIVTVGVPFSRGEVTHPAELRVLDSSRRTRPLQTQITATWRDGSVKWALLDFPLTLEPWKADLCTLSWGNPKGDEPTLCTRLQIDEGPAGLSVNTGSVSFAVPKSHPGLLEGLGLGVSTCLRGGFTPRASIGREKREAELEAGAPRSVLVEEPGPLRSVIRVEGPYLDAAGKEVLRYLVRMVVRQGSPDVEIHLTFLNPTASTVWIRRLWLEGRLAARAASITVGMEEQIDGGGLTVSGAERVELRQGSESQCEARVKPSGESRRGTRAPGWLDLRGADGAGIAVAVADFWQNFPKGLGADGDGFTIDLWPGEAQGQASEPFEADPGVARTHRIFLRPHAADERDAGAKLTARVRRPIFATVPPEHVCRSRAFGLLTPYDFEGFPLYEALTEKSADFYLRERPYGMRHFGDFYYGGRYKGKNAYGDLEYDYPLNYAMQYARTGLRKYLDAAIDQARHQADVDIDHRTGMQYKHSPRHTETEADLGHVFLRGLVEVYHLSGERRLLEAAQEIGAWLAPKVARPGSQGNERQIGWALYALTGIYEATWDPKFIEAAKASVERLVAGLGPTGKFDIRWDNRIAFFQGIAASGFLRYFEATGDERIAKATLGLCERMLGYYPEYLGRTLEALAWAHEYSGDPRYLELLVRTYETSLLRAVSSGLELGAGTIFTVHALSFIKEVGLEEPLPVILGLGPEALSSDRGLYRSHVGAPSMRMLLEVPDARPFHLLVLRSGCASDASVMVQGPDGVGLATVLFQASADLTQRRVLPIRLPDAAPGRVLQIELCTLSPPAAWAGTPNSMLAPTATCWDVVTTRPCRRVFRSEDQEGLETLTPRLYFRARPDASRLAIELRAQGEGFHGAVLYDPRGSVAAASANFIDLDDQSPHEYRLEAEVTPGDAGQLWRLDLQDAGFRIDGAEPYYATSPEAFFAP